MQNQSTKMCRNLFLIWSAICRVCTSPGMFSKSNFFFFGRITDFWRGRNRVYPIRGLATGQLLRAKSNGMPKSLSPLRGLAAATTAAKMWSLSSEVTAGETSRTPKGGKQKCGEKRFCFSFIGTCKRKHKCTPCVAISSNVLLPIGPWTMRIPAET